MANPSQPPAGDHSHPECITILGLLPPVTAEDVKQAYLAKARTMHPDRGGDPEQFIRLQKAYEEANDYVKFKAGKLEWIASKIESYAQQQEVVTAVIERGGEVEMEEADWLRKSFGEDFGHVADKLVSLRLRGPAADDLFAILLGFRSDSLKDLVSLDLVGASITDEGLLQLKGLKNLRSLDLRGTGVGKIAAEIPRWYEHLEFLGLPKGALGLLGRLGMPRRIKLATGDGPEES
jgi:curved DNA-binding protein CbpA